MIYSVKISHFYPRREKVLRIESNLDASVIKKAIIGARYNEDYIVDVYKKKKNVTKNIINIEEALDIVSKPLFQKKEIHTVDDVEEFKTYLGFLDGMRDISIHVSHAYDNYTFINLCYRHNLLDVNYNEFINLLKEIIPYATIGIAKSGNIYINKRINITNNETDESNFRGVELVEKVITHRFVEEIVKF